MATTRMTSQLILRGDRGRGGCSVFGTSSQGFGDVRSRFGLAPRHRHITWEPAELELYVPCALRSASVDFVDYTGHVSPGGPAARRTLDQLTISKISVGFLDNNAYLLACRTTGEALLIDAADEPERLSDLIGHGPDRPTLRTIV